MGKIKAWYAETPDLEQCKQDRKIELLTDSLEWLKDNMSYNGNSGMCQADLEINLDHIKDTLREVRQIN